MRNASDKRCRENQNTHSVFNNILFESRAVYGKTWKNIARPDRPQTTQYYACALHTGYLRLQTHSELFLSLHRASWYHQSPSFTNRCTLYQSYKPLKFTLKIKIAATCFGLRPKSGSLHLSLAKVTFIKTVGKSTSLWTVWWCGSVLYQVHGATI